MERGRAGQGRTTTHLSSEVLEDGGEVDGRTRTNAARDALVAQEAGNTAHGELQARLGRP